jgi:hypothetical protein
VKENLQQLGVDRVGVRARTVRHANASATAERVCATYPIPRTRSPDRLRVGRHLVHDYSATVHFGIALS